MNNGSDAEVALAAAMVGSILLILAVALVIQVLIAVWGWYVCKQKGRSGLLGAALGLVLGIIGIVICYLIAPSAEVQAQRLQAQADAIDAARRRNDAASS